MPLQCLWRDSVTLISTLLLTYLLTYLLTTYSSLWTDATQHVRLKLFNTLSQSRQPVSSNGSATANSTSLLLSERTPLERCCVHNMSPFVSSSGLSPGITALVETWHDDAASWTSSPARLLASATWRKHDHDVTSCRLLRITELCVWWFFTLSTVVTAHVYYARDLRCICTSIVL